MLTVIYRQEETQLPYEVEARLWRQLRGAFRINKLVAVPTDFPTMAEALEDSPGTRVFLEPRGQRNVRAGIPTLYEGDVVLIVGNTAEDNLRHARPEETYYIDTEGTEDHNHLYGSNAAAIALAYMRGQ